MTIVNNNLFSETWMITSSFVVTLRMEDVETFFVFEYSPALCCEKTARLCPRFISQQRIN